MAFPLPPWLNIGPSLFTSALEAGARTGLAVSEQQQRAQQLAEARAEREAQQAEREREFDTSHLLNVQKVAQDAAQLAQQQHHQAALEANQQAQESRLLNYQQGVLGYDQGRLAVEKQRADLADQTAATPTTWVPPSNGAPGYFNTRKGITVPPASVTGTQHQLGELIPVLDKVTGASLGNVIATGPSTGHFEKAAGVSLTVPQQAQVESTRARILQGQIRDSLTMPFADAAARTAYVQERRNSLEDVNRKLTALAGGTNAPTVLSPRGVTGIIHPLPKSKSDLVVGDLYDDPKRGVGRWNGTKFEAVEVR